MDGEINRFRIMNAMDKILKSDEERISGRFSETGLEGILSRKI